MTNTLALLLFVAACTAAPRCTWDEQGHLPTDCKPTLFQIFNHTFAQPYSCKGSGYNTSALFVSKYYKQDNSPQLLYDRSGAENCQGPNAWFSAPTSWEGFSTIGDLGAVPLTSVNFNNAALYTKASFTQEVKIQVGHTYATMQSTVESLCMVAFTVTNFTGLEHPLSIQYATIQAIFHQRWDYTPGFSPSKHPHA
eukprot:TRINITY_DN112754_c0_g1_i1.p1 TRINITY_DN112754_c0_g1~~TRINITY_DN112754_c0_g1_i1.p1  ORF type:complete len:196 (+),score=15.90 TRINITY_DN112754_c0_g1_i1:26-613(+)